MQWFLIQRSVLAGGRVTRDESPNLDRVDDAHPRPAPASPEAGLPPAFDGRAVRWREALSIVIEVAGIAVLSAGFWLIRPWAGLIVLGAGLIVLGFAASPRFDRRSGPE